MTTNTHILWRRPNRQQHVDAPGFETDASTETLYPLQGVDRSQAVEKILPRNSLLQLVGDHAGECISCLNGVVWITQSGNPDDILVCSGECFTIPQRGARKGTVLIQGLAQTHLKITSPA
jgi:hypothetical protein